ncbi:2-C-methyl-D-erythritol 2,4-cyclodiphosphate synthase [Striga asiatica]|uniref:2-C-methyl-D-erythritol 2,4-cyclodiphosphate synthase n=1 Tax=Striga asiatica TaxID=4170 RepID=A0A5A7PGV0_STRAF|nr:2-C-methyl-D-erythritol 2,4-cyclodiphosphate synthase [Striga asiatica]
MTADFRSLPIMILSLACSRSNIVTAFAPSMAAFRAATLTRFARSAPENPGVPRAIIIKSTVSAPTNGIDFVYEYYARRPLLSGGKKVPHTAGPHSNKHLLEFAATAREERNTGLPSYGPSKHSFTRAGWAHQEDTFRELATKTRKAL